MDAVEQYAQLGLRTLCLGWRELRDEEYKEWSVLFKEANSALVDREVIQFQAPVIFNLLLDGTDFAEAFLVEISRGMPKIRT